MRVEHSVTVEKNRVFLGWDSHVWKTSVTGVKLMKHRLLWFGFFD